MTLDVAAIIFFGEQAPSALASRKICGATQSRSHVNISRGSSSMGRAARERLLQL